MSQYRYEIDEANAVRIFDGNAEKPFLFQPDWPAVIPWESREQAEDWAQTFIAALEDPTYPYDPGDRPESHPVARVFVEEVPVEETPLES